MPYALPVVLLTLSNVFMTYAWYGHLRGQQLPIWKTILVSWIIALFEYMLMIPANRYGIQVYNLFQLKIIQEILSLLVFTGFAVFVMREPVRWNYVAAFGLILAAVALVFKK